MEQQGCMQSQSENRLRARIPFAGDAEVTPAVHVIDDDDSFRVSMIRLLSASGIAAVGYACAGEFLLARDGEASGCILLDISMPGPSGIDLLKALVARGSAPPIVFVTGRDDVLTSVDVMKAGAFDYIVKPVVAERVLHVVRRALEVDAKRIAARRELAELRARFDLLTAAERTILFGVVSNRLNKQIAADLGTCERTIKAQRARMMAKLEVTTVPELVRAAKLLEGHQATPGFRPGSGTVFYPTFGFRRRL
jgi:FixJ family two-component response regulator